MEELKPCMKCHGTREIEVHVQDGGPGWEETWEGTVTCGTCGNGFLAGNYGKGGFTKEQARQRVIESWNTRATDPLLEKMAEALEMVRAHGLNAINVSTGESVADMIDKVLQEYREREDAKERRDSQAV